MPFTIVYENESASETESSLFDKVAESAFSELGLNPLDTEISLLTVDEQAIRDINRDYRCIDKVTDVLSFPQEEDAPALIEQKPLLLGDIVICLPRACEQAAEYGHSLERELGFLFAHGLLHLLGYDHEDEDQAEQMFALQERILQPLGLTRGEKE